MDWTCVCVCSGELPNDFEVETIIGKHFSVNNKVEWLVKWMACGLCEATWVPLNSTHSPKVVHVCEAQWRGEQQAPQPKHQSKVMATLDGTKVAHTQRVDDWCKQVMHSITTTHSQWSQER